jgi:putative transposase
VPRERWAAFLVAPETILRWHRVLVRRHWTYTHRRPGRPLLSEETVELILRLARENPRWGYLRIVGELKKVGVTVSKGSVANVLRRHRLQPAPRRTGPSWTDLLHAQAKGIVATDFFTSESARPKRCISPPPRYCSRRGILPDCSIWSPFQSGTLEGARAVDGSDLRSGVRRVAAT